MVTFEEARVAAERGLGCAVETYGYEGPDEFMLIPRWAMWEDPGDVAVVDKSSGAVSWSPLVHEVMDAWPLVATHLKRRRR